MEITIENGNFEQVKQDNKYLVVDFWAEWCGPCRAIAPYLAELAEEYAGKLAVAKCNVDYNDEIASEFGIRTIPTLIFFKDGVAVGKHVGSIQKSQLRDKFEEFLTK